MTGEEEEAQESRRDRIKQKGRGDNGTKRPKQRR